MFVWYREKKEPNLREIRETAFIHRTGTIHVYKNGSEIIL